MQRRVDEALRLAYAEVHGYDALDPAGVQRPNSSGPVTDTALTSATAWLKARHEGLDFRPHAERYPMLNALYTIVSSMVGGEQPLWRELAELLGGAEAFEPSGKACRWTTFFDSGSAFGTELRSEIQRAKHAFQAAQQAVGLADPEPHPIFNAPDQAFGVSAEEGRWRHLQTA